LDIISAIFEIVKDLCKYNSEKSVDIDIIKKRVFARGHSEEDLHTTLDNYLRLNVLMR
jgi:hypothetical protein